MISSFPPSPQPRQQDPAAELGGLIASDGVGPAS